MSLRIDGLKWEERYYQDNGGDSYVVPFPINRPVHIVFHGKEAFNHGHLGYHTGIRDRLTFLGASRTNICGNFVDCRKDSATRGIRDQITFAPDSRRTLIIPPGVAHSFRGLESVHTINDYELLLPPPRKLMSSENPWATGADITNFPLDASDEEVPLVEPNSYPVSDGFYDILREFQLETLKNVDYEYPSTENIRFADGSAFKLQFRKKVDQFLKVPEWDPVPGIEGVGWRRHFVVWGDSTAGYAALLDAAPFQVIDHGEGRYDNDAYGIHLLSEDRLTFLGDSDQVAAVRLLDCRDGSTTFGMEVEAEFSPSPLRYLCIPPGVAHGFRNLGGIFTVNRTRRCAGDLTKFEPGNDVIDWHFNERPAPAFSIEANEAPLSYYKALASRQRAFIERDIRESTAMVFLADDGDGRKVRVALRKPGT